MTNSKSSIIVSLDKRYQVFIGSSLVKPQLVDSILKYKIDSVSKNGDIPTIVINADTSAYYGEVYKIMRLAKAAGAKVTAIVK